MTPDSGGNAAPRSMAGTAKSSSGPESGCRQGDTNRMKERAAFQAGALAHARRRRAKGVAIQEPVDLLDHRPDDRRAIGFGAHQAGRGWLVPRKDERHALGNFIQSIYRSRGHGHERREVPERGVGGVRGETRPVKWTNASRAIRAGVASFM